MTTTNKQQQSNQINEENDSNISKSLNLSTSYEGAKTKTVTKKKH